MLQGFLPPVSLTLPALMAAAVLSAAGCRHHKAEQAEPPPTIGELTQKMRSKDNDERYEAVKSLQQSPKDKEAVELLISALSDRDASVRWVATDGLAKCGAAAEEAIPKLTDRLQHDFDATVRAGAAHALGRVGIAGLRALGELQAAQNDPAQEVRNEAKKSVMTLRGVQKYQTLKPK
jgi:HEAT repeat protein